ncbi:retron St85 family effector protein [Serratia fonticola]|uniref:retron St85 family effector protein n=1 Tax=Serratia fonticola TaxID=47917 RepID=UPI00217A733E|nr:retron St85 family effector protein [Serratia fonticola]CAI2025371.1 Uncharacterised protein [Serratia fonticola]
MFEQAIKKQFEQLDIGNFNVDISYRLLFVCGGKVDGSAKIPPSFRDRLFLYTAKDDPELHEHFVLAETFKDYFKENAYPDLLIFEDDIASLSSLIIIFLESPGSLVELGIFCNKPEFYKKLLIIVPEEEVTNEDSFIYLGPLEYIRRKAPSSVLTYPWPESDKEKYDSDILEDLYGNINLKLDSIPKTEQFNDKISGHLALLISEIISQCYPIQLNEIEIAINSIGIKILQKEVSRYLYLLQKMEIIGLLSYSSNKYYYPLRRQKWVKFGKTKDDLPMDNKKFFMSIRQSFILSTDPLSKRRVTALRQILAKLPEGEK